MSFASVCIIGEPAIEASPVCASYISGSCLSVTGSEMFHELVRVVFLHKRMMPANRADLDQAGHDLLWNAHQIVH